MNHSYNSFLNSNLLQLLKLYLKEIPSCNQPVHLLVIKIHPDQHVQVFPQLLSQLSTQTQDLYQAIKTRDKLLLKMDRHVLTSKTQPMPFSPQEVYFLLDDESRQYLLRGYQQKLNNVYAYEFEHFLDKPVCESSYLENGQINPEDPSGQLSKNSWTIQNTDAGQKFLRLCREALEDSNVFSKFRSKLAYQNIIIGGNQDRLDKYYQHFSLSVDAMQYFSKPDLNQALIECDQIGGPVKYKWPSGGEYSVYTIRCLQTVMELRRHFGEMERWRIVEIGSGHGGLCHLLSRFINYRSYTLIDLPLVNQLAEKYLHEFPNLPHQKIRYMNTEQIMPQRYDLVISEYALSELDPKVVQVYGEKVLKYAKNAYLANNVWDDLRKGVYRKMLEAVFKKQKMEEHAEVPASDYPNYIWIYKS